MLVDLFVSENSENTHSFFTLKNSPIVLDYFPVSFFVSCVVISIICSERPVAGCRTLLICRNYC